MASDAAKHTAMHQSSPHQRTIPDQDASRAEVEKLLFTLEFSLELEMRPNRSFSQLAFGSKGGTFLLRL